MANGKSDEEILNLAFEENLVVKEDGQKYLQNNIVYKGSEINKVLSEIYSNPEYIPVKHFQIIRE